MLCEAVPPDRSGELEKIRFYIFGIERKLEALQQSKEGAVPLKIEKAFHARAVPTDNGVRPSTRRKSKHKKRLARKGVEPKGRNLMVWKSNNKTHPMNTRFPELYEVNHANTGRLQDSPFIYMQNLLNGV